MANRLAYSATPVPIARPTPISAQAREVGIEAAGDELRLALPEVLGQLLDDVVLARRVVGGVVEVIAHERSPVGHRRPLIPLRPP